MPNMTTISRYLAIALTIVGTVAFLWYFQDIVTYVILAWVVSLIGQPFMRLFSKIRIGKYRMGPTTGAFMTIACFMTAFITLGVIFIPLIIQQIQNLADVDYQSVAASLEEPIQQMNRWLEKRGFIVDSAATASPFEDLQKKLYKEFSFSGLPSLFSSLIGMTGNLMLSFFSVIFIAFFFLKEQGLFRRLMLALVSEKFEDRVSTILEEVRYLLIRYFVGISLQITVITIFVTLCLTFLGIENALLIGFFAALINVIPYLGPMIGATFGLFVTISSNLTMDFYTEMLPLLGSVLVVFAFMQMLDNFMLQPFIFSNSVQAHPLEIFIVILAAAQLYGVKGMVLAIPVYTILRVFARVFFSKFKFIQLLTGGYDEEVPSKDHDDIDVNVNVNVNVDDDLKQQDMVGVNAEIEDSIEDEIEEQIEDKIKQRKKSEEQDNDDIDVNININVQDGKDKKKK